ncbi:MAG TPA: hypothetical protein VKR32_19715, partial [Puia sp.]|nr:hypothetical protein [Puia sp.]
MQIEPAQIDRKDANVREDTMNDKKTIEKNDDFFDSHYYHLRLREQRIYTNRQIASLPEIEPGHVHHKEWVLRKKS